MYDYFFIIDNMVELIEFEFSWKLLPDSRMIFRRIKFQIDYSGCELHGPGSFGPRFNDQITTNRFYALNSPRRQETQLTQDMYIFEETISYFTQYVKIRKKSLV